MKKSFKFSDDPYERTARTKLNQEVNLVKSKMDSKESILYNLELIFLIDISGSMETVDLDPEGVGKDGLLGRGKWTRYDNMVKILKAMTADLINYDKDKTLPCYFFNSTVKRIEIKDPNLLVAQVRQEKPSGGTAMHLALQQSTQELNDVDNFLYIIFTDGIPDDKHAVETFINHEVRGRDPSGDRINLLFVRFGDDEGAIQFLEYLDDHPVFGENVDTKSDNAAFYLGPKLLVLNGIYEEIENDPQFKPTLDKLR
jgi:hypothetical protein